MESNERESSFSLKSKVCSGRRRDGNTRSTQPGNAKPLAVTPDAQQEPETTQARKKAPKRGGGGGGGRTGQPRSRVGNSTSSDAAGVPEGGGFDSAAHAQQQQHYEQQQQLHQQFLHYQPIAPAPPTGPGPPATCERRESLPRNAGTVLQPSQPVTQHGGEQQRGHLRAYSPPPSFHPHMGPDHTQDPAAGAYAHPADPHYPAADAYAHPADSQHTAAGAYAHPADSESQHPGPDALALPLGVLHAVTKQAVRVHAMSSVTPSRPSSVIGTGSASKSLTKQSSQPSSNIGSDASKLLKTQGTRPSSEIDDAMRMPPPPATASGVSFSAGSDVISGQISEFSSVSKGSNSLKRKAEDIDEVEAALFNSSGNGVQATVQVLRFLVSQISAHSLCIT